MQCVTIQNKHVLDVLYKDGIYAKTSPTDIHFVEINKSYGFMKDAYNYSTLPIFMAPIGYNVEFYGAVFDENTVAIELNIPDDHVKIQKYYDWSDFIYFIGEEAEFYNGVIPKYRHPQGLYSYGHDVLFAFENKKLMNNRDTYQATTYMLKKEWITNVIQDTQQINNRHNGSGGQYVLNKLHTYQQ